MVKYFLNYLILSFIEVKFLQFLMSERLFHHSDHKMLPFLPGKLHNYLLFML